MQKRCYKCNIEKDVESFHRSKNFHDGRTTFCKDCKSKICRQYYIDNQANCQSKSQAYYINNKDKRNKWEKTKSNADELFKLRKRLRHRLRSAFYRIKNTKRSFSAVKDLGCSIVELKSYLEAQFKPGMTWDNWGVHGWHIDHIVPLSMAKNEEELKAACHYTNLQPLWATENLSKSNKVE